MKHGKAIAPLAFCAFLLLLAPCRAYAAGYRTLDVEIPVSFQNDSLVPHTCTVTIEPLGNAPAPQQTEAQLESGGQGSFALRFSCPGIFQYQIRRVEADIAGVVCDNRVYTVTAAVRNARPRALECTLWLTVNGEEKVSAVAFVDRDQKSDVETPPQEEDTPPQASGDDNKQPPANSEGNAPLQATDNTGTNTNGETQAPTHGADNGALSQTGDNDKRALLCALIAASALTLSLLIIEGKRKQEEGEEL